MSKSDEFLLRTILVTEIQRCENDTFPIHGYTYWDFESRRDLDLESIVRAAQKVRCRALHRHMHARATCLCDMDHGLSDAIADFFVNPAVACAAPNAHTYQK